MLEPMVISGACVGRCVISTCSQVYTFMLCVLCNCGHKQLAQQLVLAIGLGSVRVFQFMVRFGRLQLDTISNTEAETFAFLECDAILSQNIVFWRKYCASCRQFGWIELHDPCYCNGWTIRGIRGVRVCV